MRIEKIKSNIIGNMKIKIGDKEINVNNRVNKNFMLGSQVVLDLQLDIITSQTADSAIRPLPVDYFSLASEPMNNEMQSTYTELSRIPISNFKCIQANMFTTTLKATGTISSSGTMRTAGFNMVTKQQSSIIPRINTPTREIKVQLSRSFSLPNIEKWTYHPEKKAFYNFNSPPFIYKIPYDIDTGIIGDMSTIASNWDVYFSPYVMNCTDGRNNRIVGTGFNESSFRVFNFLNESVSLVHFSERLTSDDQYYWDEHYGALRSLHLGKLIYLNGSVANLPEKYSTFQNWDSIICYKRDYIFTNMGAYSYVPTTQEPEQLSNHTDQWWRYDFECKRQNFIKNYMDISVTGEFSGNELTLEIMEEPKTSMTLVEVPQTQVSAGQTYEVEYSFKIIE